MTPPQRFLHRFLTACRTRLTGSSYNPVVVGNESADLDSIVSSLLYSYLHPSHPAPLLSIPSSDLSLRPELLYLLQHPLVSLPPSALLFAPEYDLTNRPIHLVDHNSPTLKIPNPNVVGIIDHHDDEHRFPSASPRLIQKSGSCASLVLQHFPSGELNDDEKRELAVLAMAAVLVDTANLTMKVTRYDEAAVELLEAWLQGGGPESGGAGKWNREKFYNSVMGAKRSIDELSLRDMLRKDYKEWSEAGKMLGIASVVRGLSWLLSRGGHGEDGKRTFLNAVHDWGKERGLDVVAVMTTDGDGDQFRRELMLWALTDAGVGVVREVEKADSAGLGLESWGKGELDQEMAREGLRRAWSQQNLEMSRKQVAPIVRECMKVGEKSKV